MSNLGTLLVLVGRKCIFFLLPSCTSLHHLALDKVWNHRILVFLSVLFLWSLKQCCFPPQNRKGFCGDSVMATWAPALLVVLLLPSCLLPSAVHCVPVSSSEEVVRNFSCSNPDLQHLVFPAPCPDKTKTLYIQVMGWVIIASG